MHLRIFNGENCGIEEKKLRRQGGRNINRRAEGKGLTGRCRVRDVGKDESQAHSQETEDV